MAYEKAEQLMEAVLYTINQIDSCEENVTANETDDYNANKTNYYDSYNYNANDCDVHYYNSNCYNTNAYNELISGERLSAKDEYARGCELLEQKVKKTIDLFQEMQPIFDDYGNRCLRDTFQKGMPELGQENVVEYLILSLYNIVVRLKNCVF